MSSVWLRGTNLKSLPLFRESGAGAKGFGAVTFIAPVNRQLRLYQAWGGQRRVPRVMELQGLWLQG